MNFSQVQSGLSQAPLPQRENGMSQVQSSKLEYLLSNYDAAALTDTDAIEIVENIRDIGIKSGRALGEFLTNAGFDSGEIAQKAGLQDKDTAPVPSPHEANGKGGEINSEALDLLSLFVDSFEGGDITADDWASFFTGLEDQGIDLSKPIVDIKV